METSEEGVKFIERHEGLRLKAYRDVEGNWTVGYGHLIKLPMERYFVDVPLTQAVADHLLKYDVGEAEHCVNSHVTVPIDQCQFDALVDFTFNLGCNALERSTLLRLLNMGERQRASDQFIRWNKVNIDGVVQEDKGLTKRRNDEMVLFNTGNYHA